MNQTQDRTRQPLTNRQREYFETIGRFFCEHHRTPTYAEIGSIMGKADQTSAAEIGKVLIQKGYLDQAPSGRGYVLPTEQNLRHLVQLERGQSFEFAGIYVGVFKQDQKTGVIGLEVIGPEIVGEPQTEQGEIIA